MISEEPLIDVDTSDAQKIVLKFSPEYQQKFIDAGFSLPFIENKPFVFHDAGEISLENIQSCGRENCVRCKLVTFNLKEEYWDKCGLYLFTLESEKGRIIVYVGQAVGKNAFEGRINQYSQTDEKARQFWFVSDKESTPICDPSTPAIEYLKNLKKKKNGLTFSDGEWLLQAGKERLTQNDLKYFHKIVCAKTVGSGRDTTNLRVPYVYWYFGLKGKIWVCPFFPPWESVLIKGLEKSGCLLLNQK